MRCASKKEDQVEKAGQTSMSGIDLLKRVETLFFYLLSTWSKLIG